MDMCKKLSLCVTICYSLVLCKIKKWNYQKLLREELIFEEYYLFPLAHSITERGIYPVDYVPCNLSRFFTPEINFISVCR